MITRTRDSSLLALKTTNLSVSGPFPKWSILRYTVYLEMKLDTLHLRNKTLGRLACPQKTHAKHILEMKLEVLVKIQMTTNAWLHAWVAKNYKIAAPSPWFHITTKPPRDRKSSSAVLGFKDYRVSNTCVIPRYTLSEGHLIWNVWIIKILQICMANWATHRKHRICTILSISTRFHRCEYRDRLKSAHQVWWILLLLP